MQLKPITAITVLLLVVSSLLVSGCTNINTTPTATPVPTPVPTTTHNPILESAANQWMSAEPLGWVHYGKKETWNGGNSVTVQFIERGNTKETLNATPLASNTTFMVFATTQDATKYIDSLDKSHYLWDDTPLTASSYSNNSDIPTAIRALGVPSVYQHWYYIEGFGTPNEKSGGIYQLDNMVQLDTIWALS